MAEIPSVRGTDLQETLHLKIEGAAWQGTRMVSRGEPGPHLSDSKDMGTSALQLRGSEFCQQQEVFGEGVFSRTSRWELSLADTLMTHFWGDPNIKFCPEDQVNLASLLTYRTGR